MRKVIYKFRKGTTTPSYENAEKLAKAFHTKYKVVLEEVPEPLYKIGTGKFRAAN